MKFIAIYFLAFLSIPLLIVTHSVRLFENIKYNYYYDFKSKYWRQRNQEK